MQAMLELGAAVGALQSGYAADKISRKYTLFLGVAWFFLGSAMQTGASDYSVLVIGRTLGGIGIGTLACVAPIYIRCGPGHLICSVTALELIKAFCRCSEVSPPHLRGLLLTFESLMICTGLVVAFFCSYGCRNISSDWSFRLPFLLQLAVRRSSPLLVATPGLTFRSLSLAAGRRPLLPVHGDAVQPALAVLEGPLARGAQLARPSSPTARGRPQGRGRVDLDPR
jgi:MFS family permease